MFATYVHSRRKRVERVSTVTLALDLLQSAAAKIPDICYALGPGPASASCTVHVRDSGSEISILASVYIFNSDPSIQSCH